ncbi:MAG: WYL domain-containing protein, partial [Coprobacillus sp.]
ITYEVVHSQLKEIPSQNGNEQDLYFVSPYQIISSNNHYYLIGYNEIHENELTTYRIDRMRLMKTIKKSFIEVREQFDVKDEIDKMTNMYISSQRETIQIECDKRLLREVASHFKTELKAEKLYHDHYLMTIEDVPISDGLIGWIMMLQDQIKVISPSSLQEEMKKRIEKMLNLYSDML